MILKIYKALLKASRDCSCGERRVFLQSTLGIKRQIRAESTESRAKFAVWYKR